MKVVSFLKKAAIALACLFALLIAGSILCARSYSHFNDPGQTSCLAAYTKVSDNVYTDATPNPETLSELNALLSNLSPNVSKVLQRDWKVIISPIPPKSLNIINETTTSSVLGYSDWHLRLIYIKAQPDTDATREVFIHELGHCFDYEFGTPSATDEFLQIYAQYKDELPELDHPGVTNPTNTSPEEFFATVFKDYFLFPEYLKTTIPKAYYFFDAIYTEASQNAEADTTMRYDLQSSLFILKKKFQTK